MRKIPSLPNNCERIASLKLQAKVRAKVGLPVIIIGLGTVQVYGTSFGRTGLAIVSFIALLHTLYVLTMLHLTSQQRLPVQPATLVYLTAVLDPLILSAWLSLTGEAGGLFVCFYLFTILGFGFRIGINVMRLCQIASMLGFGLVLLVNPFWQHQPSSGASLFLMLVVVPAYATGLIKQLRLSRAHAQYESKAKSDLLAKVSHELRTPVSSIISSSELMLAETDDHRCIERSNVILRLSNELLEEIDDLLDVARSGAAALTLSPVQFDLKAVMAHIHLVFTPLAVTKNLAFRMDVDPAIKSLVIGNSLYLKRVFKNLVGNAIKFTHAGKIDVKLSLLENGAGYYRVRFCVRDTGVGISSDAIHQIFKPFFQASSGSTRKFRGIGLGLILANDIVKRMGSEIIVESTPDIGSYFYFDVTLPTVFVTNKHFTGQPLVEILENKRILVVDDQVTILDLMQELLEKDHHIVTVARDSNSALRLMGDKDFDVIFLDYHMNEIDGGQILQIYQFGKLRRAPVFFLTADTTRTTVTKLMEVGAVGVLHKPVTSDMLRKAIEMVCKDEAVCIT